MGIYKTKQKSSILKILADNMNQELTISQIKEIADESAMKIGLTTIYRSLEELEKMNQIRKTIRPNGEAEFQLVREECSHHFHMKCSSCGKLIHLDCGEVDSFMNHISKKHAFHIDSICTTIMGLCDECYRNEVN